MKDLVQTDEIGNLPKGRARRMIINWALVPGYELHAFGNALIEIQDMIRRGAASHPDDDWRLQSCACHLARARRHLELLAAGDCSEPHLAHTATRLLMVLELARFSATDSPSQIMNAIRDSTD